jgi:hypothetical protein
MLTKLLFEIVFFNLNHPDLNYSTISKLPHDPKSTSPFLSEWKAAHKFIFLNLL